MLPCAAQHTLQSSLCFHTDTQEYPARGCLPNSAQVREECEWNSLQQYSLDHWEEILSANRVYGCYHSQQMTHVEQTDSAICLFLLQSVSFFFFCHATRCYSANRTHAPRTLMPPGWVLCLALTHYLPVVPRKAQTSTGMRTHTRNIKYNVRFKQMLLLLPLSH